MLWAVDELIRAKANLKVTFVGDTKLALVNEP